MFSLQEYRDGVLQEDRLRILVQIWNEFDCENPGAADEVAFEQIRRDVTDAMAQGKIALAESLTAQAFLLISGMI